MKKFRLNKIHSQWGHQKKFSFFKKKNHNHFIYYTSRMKKIQNKFTFIDY
jgi:hypothetical protein